MSARAMWKAAVAIGDLEVPVKLYAAVQDSHVHFRLLHAADRAPVKQQMIDPATDEPVPPEQLRKAVEVNRGIYVLLTDEEQAALRPKPSRVISIEQVVAAEAVDERWFDRPYYLGPDGDDDRYFALAEALAKREALAIAHWVLRNKRYVGGLHASGGYLFLETLRHSQEVLEVGAVRADGARASDKREIALAEQLIGALEDRFDPNEFRDEYQDKLKELLAAKAAGKVVRFPKAAKRESGGSLVASLQASLKARRKEAPHGRRA
jgi:DNA end-binding protein Ku